MRPPAVCLVGGGNGACIPLPLFLLWPFLGVAWLALMLCLLFVKAGSEPWSWLAMGTRALTVFGSLSGLRVDVQSKDGVGVNIWII